MKNKLSSFLNSICWTTYCRSFIFTTGLFFVAISTFAFLNEFEKITELPIWVLLIITAMATLGASLVCISFFAKDERIEKWANDAASGDLEVIIIIAIALPVYFLAMRIKTNKINRK